MPDRLDIDLTAVKRYEEWLLAEGGQPWLDAYHALPFDYAVARAMQWTAQQDYVADRWLMRNETFGDNN